MTIECKLSKEDKSKEVYPKHYISMIGSFLYVKASIPDSKQAIGIIVKFQAGPNESHVHTMKIIFRYLKGTIDIGFWYTGENSFTLKSYLDAYWEGYVDDRKSTSGGALFLG